MSTQIIKSELSFKTNSVNLFQAGTNHEPRTSNLQLPFFNFLTKKLKRTSINIEYFYLFTNLPVNTSLSVTNRTI